MYSVDADNQFNEYLVDENRKIPEAHLKSVCKIRQGEQCCRYLALSLKGFVCTKRTPLSIVMDNRVQLNVMKAKGNNCEGLGEPGQQLRDSSGKKENQEKNEGNKEEEGCQKEDNKEDNKEEGCQKEND